MTDSQPSERERDPSATTSRNALTASAVPPEKGALPLGVMLIFVMAALVVVAGGLRYIGSIFGPTFFALTLVVTFTPLRQRLARWHVPAWLSSVLVLVLIYAIIFGILSGFGVSIAQLIQILPRYAARFNALYTDSLLWLDARGVDTSNADLLLSQLDFNRILAVLQSVLDGVSSVGTVIFVLVMALAFLLVDSTAMEGRMGSLRSYQPQLAACLADFGYRVRRYWVVNTLFGLIVAVLDTIVLMALDVPLPLVWGLFAWVTNYIPNLGFLLGLIPPALVALLDGGPVDSLVVVIAYSVLNFVIQSFIQPKFTGDAVGLNTTVTFVSLLFWTVVIGPIGSILAVPLTLFAKSLLIDSSPPLQWVNIFLRSKDVEEPPIRPTWPLHHVPVLPRWTPWSAGSDVRPVTPEPTFDADTATTSDADVEK